MVSARHSARHLKIDKAVFDAVAPHDFAHDDFETGAGHRPVYLQFTQRAVQPVEVPRHVHDEAARDFAYLVDAVGELIATVLDMHAGVGMGYIVTIHIGNARHVSLTTMKTKDKS